MEESYIEWLVKRKDPIYALPVKIIMVLVCAFSVLLALQTVIGVVIMTAAGIGTYFIFLNLSVEYEYLFAEGGLRIDRILGKARRKKAFDCEKDDVQNSLSSSCCARGRAEFASKPCRNESIFRNVIALNQIPPIPKNYN